ncbi:MAG: DUF11 domain-containing protein, partial [Microbacteriaceae bacterium]|nr:DUF11 domain-containing protein [Microbacteriaceae bacterium]
GCGAPGAGYGNRVALLAAGTVQGEATACADIELPEMRFTKTAEVADGTRAGDIVRYVITATNVGGADFTAGDPAQLVDDMSELLDDAVAVGPVVASGGIATVVDPGLHWSGPLPAGGTITVEYAVRLHAGGDGAIVNTVQRTGLADPVAAVPDCATTPLANDAPRCAVRLALTPSQLGATGPGEVWLLLGGAILLTLIGAPLVIVMMRDSRRPSRRR